MASRQWLADNPKVLSYVPKSVYQHLKTFTDKREISISQAIILILEEYFELESERPLTTDDAQRDVKLEQLEQELKELKAKVAELKQLGENRDSRTQPTQSNKATQVSRLNQADERRPFQTNVRFELRRQKVESDSQTDASDGIENQPKTHSSLFDYSPKTSQNSAGREEKDIPIYQTTPMPKGRILRTENQMKCSKNQSISSDQKHPSNEQTSSENKIEDASKELPGRLNFSSVKKTDESGQRSFSTRPALPPPSAH